MLVLVALGVVGFYLLRYRNYNFDKASYEDRPVFEALSMMGLILISGSVMGLLIRLMLSSIPNVATEKHLTASTVSVIATMLIFVFGIWIEMRRKEENRSKRRALYGLRGIVVKSRNGKSDRVRLYRENDSILIKYLSEEHFTPGDHIFVESAIDSKTVIVRPISILSDQTSS